MFLKRGDFVFEIDSAFRSGSLLVMTRSTEPGAKGKNSPARPQYGETLPEQKVRYRIRRDNARKIVVNVPISSAANLALKESAQATGKSATALMTELLEEAARECSSSQ